VAFHPSVLGRITVNQKIIIIASICILSASAIAYAGSLKSVTVRYHNATAKNVKLTAEFTDWKPRPMRHDAKDEWSFRMKLPPGEYLYNFLVDGSTLLDPMNPKARQYGDNKASVLVVAK
jgi:1,4-alpha-glucan branching enzyme